MEKEINYYFEQYELYKRPIHSIYFGGGTPSNINSENKRKTKYKNNNKNE